MVSPKTLRATHDVASVGKNAERHAHPQALYCINCPVECIFRRGGCFLPTGTPGGGVQIPEYSASRSPQVRERVHKTALNALVLDPQCLKSWSFFTERGPWCLPFSQNPVCRHPRLLNTPKKCTPHPTPGTRSKKTNSLDLPGASDESSFGRGYSSPKLMPSALASRTRSLWGSTYLSLPATSSSGMWHILPSRRAIM